MRVAGDDAVAPHEAEEEAEGDLADAVALGVAEALDVAAPRVRRRTRSRARGARTDSVCTRGTPHVRMAAEPPLEAALMLGLDLVVELVRDPLADLGEHRARVESRREALEDRADEPEAAQVRLDGLAPRRGAAP